MMEIWATDWHFEGKHPSTEFIAKDVICLKADDKEVVMCKEWYNKAVNLASRNSKELLKYMKDVDGRKSVKSIKWKVKLGQSNMTKEQFLGMIQ
jgi:hypothetical protein